MSFKVIISGREDWKNKPPGVKPGVMEWYTGNSRMGGESALGIYNPQLMWGRDEPLVVWATVYQTEITASARWISQGGPSEEGEPSYSLTSRQR